MRNATMLGVALMAVCAPFAPAETVCGRNLVFSLTDVALPPYGGEIQGEVSAEGEIQYVTARARFRAEGTFDARNIAVEFHIPITIDGVRADRSVSMNGLLYGWSGQGVFGGSLETAVLNGTLDLAGQSSYTWRMDIINQNPAAGPIQGVFELLDFEFEMQPCKTGDVNCDGVVDSNDMDAFAVALLGVPEYLAAYPNCSRTLADINYDGVVSTDDLDGLSAVWPPEGVHLAHAARWSCMTGT